MAENFEVGLGKNITVSELNDCENTNGLKNFFFSPIMLGGIGLQRIRSRLDDKH